MAKKAQEDPPAGSPAWMATFSDLMNLLLCFFVMLYSMSNLDEAKYNELVASMSSTFSIFSGGATAIGDGFLISNGVSQLNELNEYINSMGATADGEEDTTNMDEHKNGEEGAQNNIGELDKDGVDVNEGQGTDVSEMTASSMEELLEEQYLAANEIKTELIEEAIAEGSIGDQVDVSFTAQYVQLTMKGALLFDPGSAVLKEDAKAVLIKVGTILEKYADGIIEIDGHTDNVPMTSKRYADNEELSSARAMSVFYYLKDNTYLDPANLKHAGMGERVPVADNSTEEGRSKNRRVEIRIFNPS